MLNTLDIVTACCRLQITASPDSLWTCQAAGSELVHAICPPVFEIDGQDYPAILQDVREVDPPVALPNGCREFRFAGSFVADPTLTLEMVFRLAEDNPVVRFQYILSSATPRRLTKQRGQDALTYLALDLGKQAAKTEVRFSEFNELVHSFVLVEEPLTDRQFEDRLRVMGPMLVTESSDALLVAYEHGSQAPDAFLNFQLSPDYTVALQAAKGNYFNGQPLGPGQPYTTIWLQLAAVAGSQANLAKAYRSFVLHHLTLNAESRQPYIFYNTWAYQERNQAWNGAKYLDSMTQERMLAEIDAAHRMGVDVFVLDTGWYEKTGDWRVNRQRFPDGLKAVKGKLDGYGMKLGLWFGPLHAALSSAMHRDHQDCIMSWQGKPAEIYSIWETEESQNLCLVSRYADAFADELIRLVREVGVTYFKWDAIHQYGCDAPGHGHGDAECTPQERADSYAFQLGLAMQHVVDRLCRACPEAIVDFDVTEGGRYVGLGFLAVGKYFLINNGPYYPSYDIPDAVRNWINVFVWPGPARGWVCRTPLSFDKWIPSVLFLTHYLPDDPESSQIINIASLILGQNGIWGDLLNVSEEGVARFGHLLGLYKQVRDDITAAYPVRSGTVGGNPEIHEKITNGRGAICIFYRAWGKATYVTEHIVADTQYATPGATVTRDVQGRAVIECEFVGAGAIIVLFGVSEG